MWEWQSLLHLDVILRIINDQTYSQVPNSRFCVVASPKVGPPPHYVTGLGSNTDLPSKTISGCRQRRIGADEINKPVAVCLLSVRAGEHVGCKFYKK